TTLKMPMLIETFTITFDDLTNNSAVLGILWEDVYVGLKFETPTDAMVSKNIEKAMRGPAAQDLYAAADYYLTADKDIQKAKTWIDKAVTLTADTPRFWYLRRQALIHAKAGNKKTAIAAAKLSLQLAEKAGNQTYVKMNKASLKEWGAK
ncbi:MAG: dihydrolipoamide dehydrogenase, partial [Polaribacter sp.]|nr:dihydrolipoamide dehydrogenase [Polaribacter sp.]